MVACSLATAVCFLASAAGGGTDRPQMPWMLPAPDTPVSHVYSVELSYLTTPEAPNTPGVFSTHMDHMGT